MLSSQIRSVLFAAVLITSSAFLYSCKDSSTEPGVPAKSHAHYNWQAISTNDGQNNAEYWAVSEDEGWMRHSNLQYKLFRLLNGTWTEYPTIQGTVTSMISFTPDNVWMTALDTSTVANTRGASIYHFNGIKWEKAARFYSPGQNTQYSIQDIWSDSPNNIYAVGTIDKYTPYPEQNYTIVQEYGFIVHYDGSSWKQLDTSRFRNMRFNKIRKASSTTNYFVAGFGKSSMSEFFTEVIWTFNGNNIIEAVAEKPRNHGYYINLFVLGKDMYYSQKAQDWNETIYYKYQNGKFSKWQSQSRTFGTLNNSSGILWGKSEDDYLFFSDANYVCHYNKGIVDTEYTAHSNYTFQGAVINNTPVFNTGAYILTGTPKSN